MASSPPPIPVITGPTASGKSALALRRAQDENGVIINADSMQVYDALPLLTARPDADEQAAAPHRLYAFMPPAQTCSAAYWASCALAEIAAALKAGQLPLITGGTGLYLRALIAGLSPIPDIDPALRVRGNALQAELGNPAFHALLAERDPVMAERLHPQDTQRLIRAWEVYEGTGRSLSYWQSLPPVPPVLDGYGPLSFHVTIFDLPRAVLHERCNRRFLHMIERGALAETTKLAAQIDSGAVPPDAAVTNALGFRALRDHLQGRVSLDQAVILAQTQTRQYVKRQSTWLRHQLAPALPTTYIRDLPA